MIIGSRRHRTCVATTSALPCYRAASSSGAGKGVKVRMAASLSARALVNRCRRCYLLGSYPRGERDSPTTVCQCLSRFRATPRAGQVLARRFSAYRVRRPLRESRTVIRSWPQGPHLYQRESKIRSTPDAQDNRVKSPLGRQLPRTPHGFPRLDAPFPRRIRMKSRDRPRDTHHCHATPAQPPPRSASDSRLVKGRA